MNEYMKLAVEQALIASSKGEVPVGAVIVKDNVILSSCYNRKNIENIAIYHAEILCIIDACKNIGSWYLNDCDVYVTLKPCSMCMYALAEARIKNVYYLLDSNYDDNLSSNYNNLNLKSLSDDYGYKKIITTFFKKIRDSK